MFNQLGIDHDAIKILYFCNECGTDMGVLTAEYFENGKVLRRGGYHGGSFEMGSEPSNLTGEDIRRMVNSLPGKWQ